MAYKFFEVIKYHVTLGTETGGGYSAAINCIGSHPNEHMFILFSSHNSLPQNSSIIEANKIIGHMYVPSQQYAWYLDLLRNEGPIYATVNDSNPNGNILATASEPVGEGE